MKARHPGPTLHYELRALLRLIDRAMEQKSVDSIEDIQHIMHVVAPSHTEDLIIYVRGNRERLEDERQYYMYEDADTAEAKQRLEKVAYGDFDEAMYELVYDLGSADRYRSADELHSNVFRPELFDDEDRNIWDELREVAITGASQSYSEYEESEIDAAIDKLRAYQQKSYGSLIPTMIGTYMRHDDEGIHGVSVRLAWVDDALQVTTSASFAKELEDFFIRQSPVESRKMFTPACFAPEIDGYELTDVANADLFHYEL